MKIFSLILRDILAWFYGGMILWGLISLTAALGGHSLFGKNDESRLNRAMTVFDVVIAAGFIATGGVLLFFHFH